MIQILGKLIFSVDILQGLMQLYIIASAAFGHVILENPPAMSKYKAMVFLRWMLLGMLQMIRIVAIGLI